MYAEMTRENLRRIVDAYCEAKTAERLKTLTGKFREKQGRAPNVEEAKRLERRARMTPTGVSRDFYGKSSGVANFLSGKMHMTVDRLDEFLGALAKEWPAGAKIPKCDPILMLGGKSNGRTRENFPGENLAAS